MAALVWVDTDVALGARGGDVDDGFALAALFRAVQQGRAELLGVSTVFGNTTAKESERCARMLAEQAGLSVDAVRGGESAGETTEASRLISKLPDSAELLCLGPLTNVAAACRIDPTLPERLSVRVVGGNLTSIGMLAPLWPFEFNLALDRQAARLVLSSKWRDLTLYPLDVVRLLRIGAEELAGIARSSPLGAFLADHSLRWLRRSRLRPGRRGFPLWDLPAALDLVGLLPAEHQARTLARGLRTFLGSARAHRCLVSMATDRAWRAFRCLIDAGKTTESEWTGAEAMSR
ncbi:MAG TPA: nucleoside hydrolase [Thermoanaerobaculia bacterium]